MRNLRETDYAETCPECEGWTVRISEENWIEEENHWDILVYCHDCGFEWKDWIDG